MRMFDLVLQRRFGYGQIVTDLELQEALRQSVPFFADNVRTFMNEAYSNEPLDPAMFPVAMPPFQDTWVEFTRACWMAVHTLLMDYEDVKEVTEQAFSLPAETVFVLWSRMYSSPDKRHVQGPFGSTITPLDKNGIPLFPCDGRPCAISIKQDYDHIDPKALEQEIGNCLAVALLTFCFTHMKNVTIQTAEVKPRLARAYERRHGIKPAKVRVITLDPAKEVLRKEGRIHEVGLRQALHLVRGHFAEYTEEKPLFGKHVGRFFRRPHAAGSAEFGVNLPSYIVKAPESKS